MLVFILNCLTQTSFWGALLTPLLFGVGTVLLPSILFIYIIYCNLKEKMYISDEGQVIEGHLDVVDGPGGTRGGQAQVQTVLRMGHLDRERQVEHDVRVTVSA